MATSCEILVASAKFLESAISDPENQSCLARTRFPALVHVFSSSSDWSFVLFTSVVIGRSNYLWFYDTQLKTALFQNKKSMTTKIPCERNYQNTK